MFEMLLKCLINFENFQNKFRNFKIIYEICQKMRCTSIFSFNSFMLFFSGALLLTEGASGIRDPPTQVQQYQRPTER